MGGGSDPCLDFCEGKENFLLPLSKIESRKRNGNYQIFEIEREISLSTLDFSLESETLVNACPRPPGQIGLRTPQKNIGLFLYIRLHCNNLTTRWCKMSEKKKHFSYSNSEWAITPWMSHDYLLWRRFGDHFIISYFDTNFASLTRPKRMWPKDFRYISYIFFVIPISHIFRKLRHVLWSLPTANQ